MIERVVYEAVDVERAARFYDAVFFALGARRMPAGDGSVAWGVDAPIFVLAPRAGAGPGFGHVTLRAAGKAAVDAAHEAGLRAGGSQEAAPGGRPEHGVRAYGAVLRDPDGQRVELLSR